VSKLESCPNYGKFAFCLYHTEKTTYYWDPLVLESPSHTDHFKLQDWPRTIAERKVEANALVIVPEARRALWRQPILRHVDQVGIRAAAAIDQAQSYPRAIGLARRAVQY
jgi:hypothetical protein